jgi:PBP1b-binding outer membrane lipoprotein LpoB
MKTLTLRLFALALLAVLAAGCQTTKITNTWKAPDYQGGPMQKVAVLAVDNRSLLREILENHFSNYLIEQGQPAFRTHNVLSLQQIKDDRDAAVAAIKKEGVDSVLIIRLVDSKMRASLVRQSDAAYVPIITGMDTGIYGWYDYYSVAYMDMGVTRGDTKTTLYLQSTLYDLKTGKMVWSSISTSTIKEETDRVAAAKLFIQEVHDAGKAAGVLR